MDWKSISATVVGSIILAALMFLFSSIGESKHNDDIQNIHQGYLIKSSDKAWNFYDNDKAVEISEKFGGSLMHKKGNQFYFQYYIILINIDTHRGIHLIKLIGGS